MSPIEESSAKTAERTASTAYTLNDKCRVPAVAGPDVDRRSTREAGPREIECTVVLKWSACMHVFYNCVTYNIKTGLLCGDHEESIH